MPPPFSTIYPTGMAQTSSNMSWFSQRIKGAIDRTIAEEQARAKAALEGGAPGSSHVRNSSSLSRTTSAVGTQASRRPRPSQDMSADGTAATSDPAVFEAAFVIDDTDETNTPSRVGTPVSTDKEGKGKDPATPASNTEPVKEGTDPLQNGDRSSVNRSAAGQTARSGTTTPSTTAELSPEIRVRLRKLDKLEKTYPGSCSFGTAAV